MEIEMTREEFAERIHWPQIIWVVIIANPLMIVPQWWEIISTGRAQNVSLLFLMVLLGLQWAWSVHGFFIRDNSVFVSNGLAGLSTLVTALTALYFR